MSRQEDISPLKVPLTNMEKRGRLIKRAKDLIHKLEETFYKYTDKLGKKASWEGKNPASVDEIGRKVSKFVGQLKYFISEIDSEASDIWLQRGEGDLEELQWSVDDLIARMRPISEAVIDGAPKQAPSLINISLKDLEGPNTPIEDEIEPTSTKPKRPPKHR